MIKSRVNLYSAALLPPKQRLHFKALTMAVVGLMMLSGLVYGLSALQLSQTQDELKVLNQQKSTLTSQKDELEIQVSKRMANPELVAKVAREEQRLTLKRLLKDELNNRTALISQGYSPLLTELAMVADNSIWLSRIHLNEQHIEFEGFGLQPSSVPRWVDRLKMADTLKGYAFASMTMDRGEDQPLAFKLTSAPDTKEATE
ncbi:PilN domain-containing protein [Shewanella gaetbuli]|uniref:Fimbrial assembly protein n=1 Tax=Shewanella gaetbuli TaxID=220752 RepID=A0A9X1ZGU4_9GAMM|nr:fimbrial assembly protein [Shewanella gaetbuli]